MSTLVVDASIAVKWVVEEDGTPQALMLRRQAKLIAPDLLIAACANILWKKVQRNELSKEEAILAARLLQGAEIEPLPTRSQRRLQHVSRSNSTIRPMIASISP